MGSDIDIAVLTDCGEDKLSRYHLLLSSGDCEADAAQQVRNAEKFLEMIKCFMA